MPLPYNAAMVASASVSARLPFDADRIAAFCHKWRVRELSLFGSVLREDFRSDSDVDVLVELQPDHGLSLYDWVDMIEELEGIFGRPVDLVSKTAMRNPIRRKAILESHRVIHAA